MCLSVCLSFSESLCKLLRIKRAFKGTANVVNIAVRAGKRAVQKMLQDSKQLSENTLYRNYVKSGGISRAKSDFEALRPNNVLEHTTDDGVMCISSKTYPSLSYLTLHHAKLSVYCKPAYNPTFI